MRPEDKEESATERERAATMKALGIAGQAWEGNPYLFFEESRREHVSATDEHSNGFCLDQGAGNPAKRIDCWLDHLTQRSLGLKFCSLIQEHMTEFKDQCI